MGDYIVGFFLGGPTKGCTTNLVHGSDEEVADHQLYRKKHGTPS